MGLFFVVRMEKQWGSGVGWGLFYRIDTIAGLTRSAARGRRDLFSTTEEAEDTEGEDPKEQDLPSPGL